MITVTIGKAATNHIVVDDRYASLRHCQITLAAGADPLTGWVLRDSGSTNGTRVIRDGVDHKVNLGSWWQMRPGDQIVVGRTVLRPFTPQALL